MTMALGTSLIGMSTIFRFWMASQFLATLRGLTSHSNSFAKAKGILVYEGSEDVEASRFNYALDGPRLLELLTT